MSLHSLNCLPVNGINGIYFVVGLVQSNVFNSQQKIDVWWWLKGLILSRDFGRYLTTTQRQFLIILTLDRNLEEAIGLAHLSLPGQGYSYLTVSKMFLVNASGDSAKRFRPTEELEAQH